MAASYTAIAQVAPAASRVMVALYNGHATRILKVSRIWMTGPQASNVTGGLVFYQLSRYTNASAPTGTAVTPVAHLSTNTLTTVTCVHTATANVGTPTEIVKAWTRSSDECTAAVLMLEEIQNLMPLAIVWDSGYGDTNVQPLVCRQTEGIAIQVGTKTGTYVGTTDIHIEFTHE